MFKILSTYSCRKKYIKCNIWRVAVLPSYIQDARFLKVNVPGTCWRAVFLEGYFIFEANTLPSSSVQPPLMQMQAVGSSETLFPLHKTTRCYLSENRTIHTARQNPKFRVFYFCLSTFPGGNKKIAWKFSVLIIRIRIEIPAQTLRTSLYLDFRSLSLSLSLPLRVKLPPCLLF